MEAGFAIQASELLMDSADADAFYLTVKHMLERNHQQYLAEHPELEPNPPMLLVRGPDQFGKLDLAWYVNTEFPEQVGPVGEEWRLFEAPIEPVFG